MKNLLLLAVLSVFLLAGCVSYQYKDMTQGKKFPANEGTVKIYTESAKVPKKYEILGEATVSGNYQNVGVDRMIGKLKSEAQKRGASAVLITERQVIPYSMDMGDVPKQAAFDQDNSNHTWSDLGTEIDQNIKDISFGKKKQQQPSTSPRADFKRIIRAQYLRYLPEEKTAPKGK